jgi:hypothetical protein
MIATFSLGTLDIVEDAVLLQASMSQEIPMMRLSLNG